MQCWTIYLTIIAMGPFLVSYPHTNFLTLKLSSLPQRWIFCPFMIFLTEECKRLSLYIHEFIYPYMYVYMHVWNMCLLNTCIFFAISIFMCHSPFKIIPFKSYNKKTQTSLPTPSNNRLFVNQAYSSSLLITESFPLKDVFRAVATVLRMNTPACIFTLSVTRTASACLPWSLLPSLYASSSHGVSRPNWIVSKETLCIFSA